MGTEFQMAVVSLEVAFEVGYRLTVGVTVVNAESAPHIDVLDADMASFQPYPAIR